MTEYAYFAKLRAGDTVEAPSALWRRTGEAWEYLSLLDWQWHPGGGRPLPPPASLTPVSPEQAAALLADRQRFVRYWFSYRTPAPGPGDRPVTVYRRRSSPERQLDEVYGRDDRWMPTPTIREAESSRGDDPTHLVPTDPDSAERFLRDVRGVSGATRL